MQHISFFCGREPVTKRVVGFVATSALGTGPVREISRYPSSRLGLTGARGGGRFKLVERCTHFRAWPRFQHGCVNVVAHLTARLCVALVALSPIEATRLRRSVYFQGSRCLFFFSRSVVNRQTAACTTIPVECCLFTLIYCHSSDIVAKKKKKAGLERERELSLHSFSQKYVCLCFLCAKDGRAANAVIPFSCLQCAQRSTQTG